MNELKTPGLNTLGIQSLAGAAKWAKFLAIVGFVLSGIIFVMSFFMGSIISMAFYEMPMAPMMAGIGAMMTVVYLCFAIVIFLLYFFLYKFASGVKKGLASGEEVDLAAGLKGLKTYFMIEGIIMIIALGFVALGIIMGAIAGVAIM